MVNNKKKSEPFGASEKCIHRYKWDPKKENEIEAIFEEKMTKTG